LPNDFKESVPCLFPQVDALRIQGWLVPKTNLNTVVVKKKVHGPAENCAQVIQPPATYFTHEISEG